MSEKSRMTADWIERVWRDNPCTVLANGDVRMGPCRLAFVNILERPKARDGSERAFGSVLLVPEGADLKVLKDEAVAQFTEHAPAALTNKGLFAKYHNPFKDQGSFVDLKTGDLYEGFIEGRVAISANSSQTQPYCVDQRGTPIVDKTRVYSGCWALPVVRCGWIKRDDNKGPTFYLQGVVVVADDENLGGVGASNPQAALAGIKIDPSVNAAALFDNDDDPLAGGGTQALYA